MDVSAMKHAAMLEEYKTLREEIGRRQEARLLVVGFTVTATGATMGVALGHGPQQAAQGPDLAALALLILAQVTIITALLLAIQQEQTIDRIAAYIRTFIEPVVDGLHWEARWASSQCPIIGSKAASLPQRAKRPLALCYGFLALATYGGVYGAGLARFLLAVVATTALFGAACYFACDLWTKRSGPWRANWEAVRAYELQQGGGREAAGGDDPHRPAG